MAAELDSLDLSEKEHAAVAVLLAAGLESGRARAEVEGFMPNAVELSPTLPFGSQIGAPAESVTFNFEQINMRYTPQSSAPSESSLCKG